MYSMLAYTAMHIYIHVLFLAPVESPTCTWIISLVKVHKKNLMFKPACYTVAVTLAGFREKFWIQNRSTSQGLPYDFSSIMHFQHNAFSRGHNKSTVVPHNSTISKTILGSSNEGTNMDFLHINLLYCGGEEAKWLHCYTTVWNIIVSAWPLDPYFRVVRAYKDRWALTICR